MNSIKNIFLLTGLLTLLFASCGDDYLNVDPTSTITADRLKELGDASPEAFMEVLRPQVNRFVFLDDTIQLIELSYFPSLGFWAFECDVVDRPDE